MSVGVRCVCGRWAVVVARYIEVEISVVVVVWCPAGREVGACTDRWENRSAHVTELVGLRLVQALVSGLGRRDSFLALQARHAAEIFGSPGAGTDCTEDYCPASVRMLDCAVSSAAAAAATFLALSALLLADVSVHGLAGPDPGIHSVHAQASV